MIEIRINPVYAQIYGLENQDIIDALSLELSYLIPSYQYSMRYKRGGWDGRERLLRKRLQFPSGLVPRVRDFLQRFNLAVQTVDTIPYVSSKDTLSWQGPSLRPYQEMVVERALESRRGMIKVATGGGKTITLSRIVAEYNLATMVYVVSLDLLNQMRETLESTLGIEVGIIGGGECKVRQINVCSVWTAGLACGEKLKKDGTEDEVNIDKWSPSNLQREEIRQAIQDAQVVILDEAQFAAANSIRMILRNSVNASYKFGMTATPWRTGGDDILLEAAFGHTICDINATELIRQGYLVPPKIVFRDIPEYHKKLPKEWPAVKSSYIVNNDVRNNILINNVKVLLEMGRKPLMLFREIRHGKSLFSQLPSDINAHFATGELSGQERDRIRQEFQAGHIDLILASQIFDQGIDLKSLDALVLCGGGKSTAKALQRIGRVIRGDPDGIKKDAIVVETYDQAHYVKKHSMMRYGIYRTEEAFYIQTESAMNQALPKG